MSDSAGRSAPCSPWPSPPDSGTSKASIVSTEHSQMMSTSRPFAFMALQAAMASGEREGRGGGGLVLVRGFAHLHACLNTQSHENAGARIVVHT